MPRTLAALYKQAGQVMHSSPERMEMHLSGGIRSSRHIGTGERLVGCGMAVQVSGA